MLLGLLAWRFLRHPDRNAQTGRMVIGWGCLLLGGLGLVHIAAGTPQPAAGESAMRSGAGLIGFFVSAPLVAALTPRIAAPLLALVSGFGLLVITGTPVHRVPDRLAELRGLAQRGGDAGLDTEDDSGAGIKGAATACAARAAANGPRPSKPASTTAPTTRPSSERAPGERRRVPGGCAAAPRCPSPPTRPSRPPRTRTSPCSTRWASGCPGRPGAHETAAHEAAHENGQRPDPGPHDPAAGPVRGEQLTLTGSAESSYILPPMALLKPGSAPKARTRANDVVVRALTEVLEQFEVLRDRAPHRSGEAARSTWSSTRPPFRPWTGAQTSPALDDALTALASIDPREAKVVELRFFGGRQREANRRSPGGFRRNREAGLESREGPAPRVS